MLQNIFLAKFYLKYQESSGCNTLLIHKMVCRLEVAFAWFYKQLMLISADENSFIQ